MTDPTILANAVLDAQIDFYMKITLFLVVTLYTVGTLWWFSRNEYDNYALYIVKRLSQAWAISWFAMLPLWVGSLYRTFEFKFIFAIVVGFYGFMVVIVPLFFMLGYGEHVMRWFFGLIGKESFFKFRRGTQK